MSSANRVHYEYAARDAYSFRAQIEKDLVYTLNYLSMKYHLFSTNDGWWAGGKHRHYYGIVADAGHKSVYLYQYSPFKKLDSFSDLITFLHRLVSYVSNK